MVDMEEKIHRIILDTGKKEEKNRVVANLSLCDICGINFTIKSPCVLCDIMSGLTKKLGRKPTQEEWENEVGEWGMD